MHMYLVVQTSPLRFESVVALHGTIGEATAQVDRLNNDPELNGFRYHVEPEPFVVTYMPIEREDTK